MATITSEGGIPFAPGMWKVRLTTVATTDTYESPYGDTVAVVATNETDDDGVGIGVAAISAGKSQTITITVGTLGDVVTLLIVGRK